MRFNQILPERSRAINEVCNSLFHHACPSSQNPEGFLILVFHIPRSSSTDLGESRQMPIQSEQTRRSSQLGVGRNIRIREPCSRTILVPLIQRQSWRTIASAYPEGIPSVTRRNKMCLKSEMMKKRGINSRNIPPPPTSQPSSSNPPSHHSTPLSTARTSSDAFIPPFHQAPRR